MGQTVQHIRPNFDHPPLVEQAITLMFEPIVNFSIGHFGLYWETIGQDFPSCVGDEVIPSSVESFDVPDQIRFQLGPVANQSRCVFRHRDGHEVVQVQNDRFSFNWLREADGVYPRYEATAGRFWEMFEGFSAFLASRGLASPVLTQCELTNVNVILLKDWGGDMDSTLNAVGFGSLETEEFPHLAADAIEAGEHYRLLDDSGLPIGRLHIALQTVTNVRDRQQALRYDLTARGAPFANSRSGAEKFFECARSAINAAFLASTSKEARVAWGEKR
jgi:uncharacterized protein (TIGR04255 family)